MKFYSFFFVILVLVSNSFAQGRETKSFGNDWLFFKGDQNWMVPLAAGTLKAVGKNNPLKNEAAEGVPGKVHCVRQSI